jgi:RimJ/RimL family protein N-acetyltransferase
MSPFNPTTVSIGGDAVRIRRATEADAAGMLELRRKTAVESEFLSLYPDEVRWTPQEHAEIVRRKVGSPANLYAVAELAGRIVGFASLDGQTFRKFEHDASLGMAVLRELWGKGLGRALLDAVLEWADARGLVRVSLEVVADNARAVRLYESAGFEHEGRLRARRRHGDRYVDNLVMGRIRLPPAP